MDELVIKVPAPFSGIEDLGFTARYPVQERTEPLRDIPLIVEGPAEPMSKLVARLQLFAQKDTIVGGVSEDDAYSWTVPVQLTDEVCVLAFRDQSFGLLGDKIAEDIAVVSRGYVWNLVRPMAFTFLRDCVRIGQLRLAEQIAVVLDPGHPPVVDFALERSAITPQNGPDLLFAA
jgi:hypothetical protein